MSLLFTVFLVAPVVASAENYTTELQSAYTYAHSIGITTMPSIDAADMYGNLIRSHMAKMMVNYSKNVLGKTPDTSVSCNFTDVAGQSAELQGYIKEACQLGIMGQWITAFNPNGVVTRAQFGTVLSRALRGNLFDGADPYYKDHLQSLKDVGIMTKIDTPSANEIRGYVMLMMMRVVEWGSSDSRCDTQENQFYCSLGLDLCPSQCQANTNSAGTLSIQKNTDTYDVSDGVHVGSLQLSASNSDITVNTITLQAGWANSSQLRLEQDGVRISPKVTPASDETAVLTVWGVRINAWSSVVLHIVATSNISSLRLLSTSQIQSSALSVVGGFPISIY